MKKDWTYKKLGEVCSSDLGKTLNQSKDTGTPRPYLCAINILWDKVDLTTLKQTKFEDSELERYTVRKGDLLVCEGGDIGRAAIWDKDETIQYQNALHRIRFNGEVLPRFCLLHLLALKNRGELDHKYGKGVTIKHLVKSSLLSIPIPVPSIEEQQQIVAELDLLSDVIEKQKVQLEELDKLTQSIFYDMFGDPVTNEKGWETKKIGEIGKVERGAGISKKDFVEEGLPCIHYGQLHTCLEATTHKHITCIPNNLMPMYKIARPGDVIMAITSEDVEGSCTSTAWLGKYDIVVGSDAAIFHHSMNGVYISYYTRTKAFYFEKAKYAKGFKVTHISTKEIESIPIPIPPLSLQQEFAAKVEAIEAMKAKVRQSLKESETLFNSRMDYYFN